MSFFFFVPPFEYLKNKNKKKFKKKNYEHLKLVSGENARNIHLIESAICMLILDPNVEPNSLTEVASNCLVGNYTDVWADKSVHIMFYGNGRSGGLAEVSFGWNYEKMDKVRALLVCAVKH